MEVASEAGELASVVANGRLHVGCVISRATMNGGLEVTQWELLFKDGLVKYAQPRGVDLGYDVAIAPRDAWCWGVSISLKKRWLPAKRWWSHSE